MMKNSSNIPTQYFTDQGKSRLPHFLLRLLLDELQAEIGALLLLDREEKSLFAAASVGQLASVLAINTPLDESNLTGQVIRTETPLHLHPDSLVDRVDSKQEPVLDAWLLPLQAEGKLIGVFYAATTSDLPLAPQKEPFIRKLQETTVLLREHLKFHQRVQEEFSQQEAVKILRVFNSTRDFNKLIDLSLSLGLKMLHTDLGLLTLFKESGREYDTFAARGIEGDLLDHLVVNLKQSIDHHFFHRERDTLIENISELSGSHPYHFLAGIDHFKSVLVIPLLYGYRIIGRLHLFNPAQEALVPENMRRIMCLATEAGIALSQALESRNTDRRAHLDELTGLLSRGTWLQRLDQEIHRSRRQQNSLAVILVDIDFFKVYNDTYGHQTGDQILQMLAGLFQESLRDVDSAGRYGGDEFVLLLPDTDLNGAILVANRILQEVRQLELGDSNTPLSISIGMMAQPPLDMESLEIIHLADQALLQAKYRGRSQIIAHTENGEFHDFTGMSIETELSEEELEEYDSSETAPATAAELNHVFMIDSESNQRQVLADVFRNWGYDVLTYSNGEEALKSLKTNPCDLVITNLQLPGIKGLDVVRSIKQVDMTIPVIVLTNYGSIQTAIEAIRLGADDYIVHPFSLEEVRRSIENAVSRKQRYFSAEMADHYIEPGQKTHLRDTLHRSGAELTWEAQQLRILEEFNRRSLQQVGSALLLLDNQGKVIHLNQRARELLKAQPDILDRKSLFHVYPDLEETPLHQGFRICCKTGEQFEFGDLWLSPGKGAPRTLVSLQITPLPGEERDQSRYLLQIDDVFDKQLLDESRDRALRQMGVNLENRLLPMLDEIRTVLQQATAAGHGSEIIEQRLQEMRAVLRNSHIQKTRSPKPDSDNEQRQL
jgi:diguanylate cyclase (GGDEF)-like protein